MRSLRQTANLTQLIMKNIAKNLERYLDLFINEIRQQEFYIGLSDYVNYIIESPILGKIARNVLSKKVLESNNISSGADLRDTFGRLFNFQKAYIEATKKTHFFKAWERFKNDKNLENKDAADIVHMAQELRAILVNYRDQTSVTGAGYLKIPVFKQYCRRVNTYLLKELSLLPEPDETKEIKTKPVEIVLFLDQSGDLWKQPKEKFCYRMISAKGRLEILKFLIRYKVKDNYIETRKIADKLGREATYIRSELGKMKKSAKSNLKINLIDSKQGSGYRLNPNIKILPR